MTAATPARRFDPLLSAIILSAVAAFIHVLVIPEHFEEWVGYGMFSFVAAAAQAVYAVLLVFRGPTRLLLWLGIVGNVLIIGLWAVTRTVGIPYFGPEAGEVEPVALLDLSSKIVEVALVACLVQLLRTTQHVADHAPVTQHS